VKQRRIVTDAEQIICEAWKPLSEVPAWQWVSENIELPSDSELRSFDFELFPLAKFALDQLCHNALLKRYTEMVSAQSGKTIVKLSYVCWKIINRPSSLGWFTDTGINAKSDYKTKVLPMLESCKEVEKLLPTDRAKKNNTLIQFGFMNLRVMGAESKSNREGKTIAEVLCDEVRNYPDGAMEQIDNRFKTISNWRRILFSSAGKITQEPWLSFEKGTRHMGFWNCPKCGHKQTFRFGKIDSALYPNKRACGGFIWDTNEKTHPQEDVFDFKELIPTIRYQCENEICKHLFEEKEKLSLIASVKFEQTNPMADMSDVSVHCWEAYMPFAGCSWANIVTKFLKANVAKKRGNIEPMKIFVTETLGEPWEERGEKIVEGEIVNCAGQYSVGEEWPSEIKCARQIVVDVQHGYVKYNYSMFKPDGEKRTVRVGTMADLNDVRAFQLAKKIKDFCVGVDCAHTPGTVLGHCLRWGGWVRDPKGGREHVWAGWRPLIGDSADDFTTYIVDNAGNRVPIKSYWKAVLINANEGMSDKKMPIHRYSWSNSHYKEELYLRRIKQLGAKWEIPEDIGADYHRQLSCTERIEVPDAEGKVTGHVWKERGRHDDADNEQMQLVLADINGIN
jgi:hypothetical protein